jgi:hypothetical protein
MSAFGTKFGAIALAVLATAASAHAATTINFTNDPDPSPTADWSGFMNVSNLPSAGGAYQFGSPWGRADLTANLSGANLVLGPNTIGDPDPYWYTPSGGPGAAGNKIMEANCYFEYPAGALANESITFNGTVISNTLTSAHQAYVFIKDFAPDFSSVNATQVPITSAGPFSISLNTLPGTGRHVQYGFQMVGKNVWATDVAPFGTVVIGPVPEPATLGSLAAAGAAVLVRRRRR